MLGATGRLGDARTDREAITIFHHHVPEKTELRCLVSANK
jgi:hypothetical protein